MSLRWIALGQDQGRATAIDEAGRAWRMETKQNGDCWCPLPSPPELPVVNEAPAPDGDPEIWGLLKTLVALIIKRF